MLNLCKVYSQYEDHSLAFVVSQLLATKKIKICKVTG
jgi:hypothetical protein